ncbi:MAG: hypothetical protein ABI616_06530 [Pseudomonadota bacterium]
MNESNESLCTCNSCPGTQCGCGCQGGAQKNGCSCGAQCNCGDACGCAEYEAGNQTA